MFAINLGGEGEVPNVLNQQPPSALDPHWRCSRRRDVTLRQLAEEGHVFLICPNTRLPFPESTFDTVYTDGVPLDLDTPLGPGV